MILIYPPNPISVPANCKSIFLAGSIDMGNAPDWQSEVSKKLAHKNVVILNPRRLDWDSSWEQTIDNPNFNQQVNWELEGLEKADMILMYFAPQSQAPISMLELGLHACSHKLVVCCPEGFWRKGNVDIVCKRYGIKQVASLEQLVEEAMAL